MVFKTGNNDINAWHVVNIFQAEPICHQHKYGKNILRVNKHTNNYLRSTNAAQKPYSEGLIHTGSKRRQKLAREVIILMDTTYWGRNFGVMLFKDSISKEIF